MRRGVACSTTRMSAPPTLTKRSRHVQRPQRHTCPRPSSGTSQGVLHMVPVSAAPSPPPPLLKPPTPSPPPPPPPASLSCLLYRHVFCAARRVAGHVLMHVLMHGVIMHVLMHVCMSPTLPSPVACSAAVVSCAARRVVIHSLTLDPTLHAQNKRLRRLRSEDTTARAPSTARQSKHGLSAAKLASKSGPQTTRKPPFNHPGSLCCGGQDWG